MEFSKIVDYYNNTDITLNKFIELIGEDCGLKFNNSALYWFIKDISNKNEFVKPIKMIKDQNTYKFICKNCELFKVEKLRSNQLNTNDSLLRTSFLPITDKNGLMSSISNDQFILGTNGLYEPLDSSLNKYRYITFNNDNKRYYVANVDKNKGKISKTYYNKNEMVNAKFYYSFTKNLKEIDLSLTEAEANNKIVKFLDTEFSSLTTSEYNRTYSDVVDQYFYDIRLTDKKEKYRDIYLSNKSQLVLDNNDNGIINGLSIKGINNRNKEDFLAISNPAVNDIKLLCVTDFINGSKLDNTIIKYIILEMKNWLYKIDGKVLKDKNLLLSSLENKILKLNQEINKEMNGVKTNKKISSNYTFGSSLGLALVTKDSTYIINYGDTRIYATVNDELYPLTIDNTSIWDMYKNNEITKDEAVLYQKGAVITNYIGHIKNYFKLPRLCEINNTYDKLFIFSDGVTDNIKEKTIGTIIQANKSNDVLKEVLLQAYKNQNRHDDITGVCYIKKRK